MITITFVKSNHGKIGFGTDVNCGDFVAMKSKVSCVLDNGILERELMFEI